tara:strand:+ start:548 stop:769 length:222 start_codon:yes stop_codon:yes gene_type:complete
MEQYKYSGFEEHKKGHDDIIEKFLNLKEMQSLEFKSILSALTRYLNLWIEEHIKHIEGNDKRLAKFLHSKGVT